MKTAAEVTLEWADGEYLFALKYKQIKELERICDAGIGVILARIATGQFGADEILETLRLGLIGGGMDAVAAKNKVEVYSFPLSKDGDPHSNMKTAHKVVEAVMFGLDEVLEMKRLTARYRFGHAAIVKEAEHND